MTKASLVLPVVLAVLASACAAPFEPTPVKPTPPVSTAPASIQVLAASRSDQRVDVTALVRTVDGKAVPDVSVTFSASSGTLSPEVATTNSNGEARAILTPQSAQTMVRAQADGVSSSLNVLGSPPSSTPPSIPPSPAPPVPDAPLTVTINAPPTSSVGAPTTFGLSTQALVQAVWSFGDGGTLTTTTGTATHVYSASAVYQVTATVTDTRGRTATGSISVTIQPAPPPPAPPPPSLTLTLNCTPVAHPGNTPCNIAATNEKGEIVTSKITQVTWDWGDGSQSPAGSPPALSQHRYDQAGVYVVQVTVTAEGIVGQTSKSITIP